MNTTQTAVKPFCQIASLHASRDLEDGGSCDCIHCQRECECLEPSATTNAGQPTKGPWRVGDAGHTVFGPPNGNPSPETVCSASRANARLIAAAPELLEACKYLVEESGRRKLNVRKDFSLMNARAFATKIILKATTV